MAKVRNNIVTTGLSGKPGNLIVFLNRGGKTVISKTPLKREQEPTEVHQQHQLRFQEAVFYETAALPDPAKKEAFGHR